ncbi:MAG: ATP-binding cassette domain-containing protein [Treponema sp.]|jgi:zinc transport system ATP-binding protein|nr:ATP-binding cassette domain-containing protein [Treponema sp.]
MLINCQNLSFGYDGHIVVRGLNFSVQTGDFLLIAGENGSGKSTLVKGLLRLINPMEGKINFSSDFKQSQTGYLSQQTAAKQDFPAGVMEIVLSGNLGKKVFLPFYTLAERRTAEEKLRLLDIENLKDRCFRELSGGQQRRVLLARSLCAAEKLLVLDEPFAGLDPLISAELYLLLEKINRETGITVIMVSHEIEAANCAKNVLHLQKQQLFFGSMEDYRKSETGRNFLGEV